MRGRASLGVLMLDYALLQHRVDLSVGLGGEHERVERLFFGLLFNRLD